MIFFKKKKSNVIASPPNVHFIASNANTGSVIIFALTAIKSCSPEIFCFFKSLLLPPFGFFLGGGGFHTCGKSITCNCSRKVWLNALDSYTCYRNKINEQIAAHVMWMTANDFARKYSVACEKVTKRKRYWNRKSGIPIGRGLFSESSLLHLLEKW